jgi:hypothetical protein
MNLRNVAIGSATAILLLIIFLLLLRGCEVDGGSTRADLTTVEADADDPNVEPCTADPETGICYPRERSLRSGFDQSSFMSMVFEHQRSSSSSSRRSPGALSTSASASSPAILFASSSRVVSNRSTASVTIIGSGSVRSGASRSSLCSGSFWFRPVPCDASPAAASSSARNSGGMQSSPVGGSSDIETYDSDFDYALPADEGDDGVSANGGGDTGGGDRGYLPSGRCDRSRSLLAMFDPSELTRGSMGFTFPVLLSGDCPITAAILKGPQNAFGGPLNDF